MLINIFVFRVFIKQVLLYLEIVSTEFNRVTFLYL